VIDATVIGIAGAGPLWEFLLRPRFEVQGESSGQQFVMLVEIFALLAFVGALGRISATTGRARLSLRALYVSQAAALVGFVVSVVTTDQATNGRAGWVTLVWIVCYLCLGGALLHPYSASLPVPERYRGADAVVQEAGRARRRAHRPAGSGRRTAVDRPARRL
jgi:hypothetical protein